MKSLTIFTIAFLNFSVSLFAQSSDAPSIKTIEDFKTYLCSTPWTWERPGHGEEINRFKTNSKVTNDKWGWTNQYAVVNLHKVVLRHPGGKMEIIFGDDYKSYSGEDFEKIKLSGKPKTN